MYRRHVHRSPSGDRRGAARADTLRRMRYAQPVDDVQMGMPRQQPRQQPAAPDPWAQTLRRAGPQQTARLLNVNQAEAGRNGWVNRYAGLVPAGVRRGADGRWVPV